MIKKILSLVLQQFMALNLIMSPIMAADSEIVLQERTLSRIDGFLKSSSPSDIPFIDYVEQFRTESSQPLKNFNLTGYEGKKVYVGYGTYDEEQNFCRYVEKPGVGDINTYFEKIRTFNKKSYAKSLTTMSYNSCLSLAASFGGKPVSITSTAENAFVYSTYTGASKWIGLEKASCSSSYINTDGIEQEYYNWSTRLDTSSECNASELNVAQLSTGTWSKKSKESLNSCIIEVDSEVITRPIKICAPWWKIEKEFYEAPETSFFGVDVYKINQADIPDQITVCTKYTTESLAAANEETRRAVTCTSYYDSLMAPECLLNPEQAICHVDECDGYIKQACRKTDTITPFKDYTKVQAMIDGSMKTIKGKSLIKTNVYDCPASMPSLDNCLEKSTLIIYPQECPGTHCSEYNECVLNSSTIAQKNECSTTYPCEKIYASGDSEKTFNAAGEIESLYAYCEDGTRLTFEPNLQSKNSKKCLEYDVYQIEEEVSERCELERPYTDHVIDTSTTETDIYMNNPDCVRMNNLVEARPVKEVKFDYTNNGYAQTVIKKTYLNGEESEDVREGDDTSSVSPAESDENLFSEENVAAATVSITPSVISACTNYTESWYQKIDKVLNLQTTISGLSYTTSGIYTDSYGGTPYTKIYNVPTSAVCTSLKTSVGGTSESYNSTTKVCTVSITKDAADQFSLVKGEGTLAQSTVDGETITEYSNYSFITSSSISKASCQEIAYCLNGQYNESAYASSASSQCQVSMGDDYEYTETSSSAIGTISSSPESDVVDENCMPYSSDGGYLSQLDGLQDIYSVQEVVDGDFGYYSNYNGHYFRNNVINVNEKEVYPIMPIPVITDSLVYSGEFVQTSILTKSPNIVAGAAGGVAAGAATAGYMAYASVAMTAGPIGLIAAAVIVVFVVAAMVFGKKTKLNEQKYDWIVYKWVPQERYVANIYGYDHRTLQKNDDGSVYVNTEGNLKLIYINIYGFTGTLKPGDFSALLASLSTQKLGMLTCMGWMKTEVESLILPAEKGVVVGYPKCKSLSWSCNKRKSETFTKNKDPFFKDMTNIYLGATNGVSIVVPYLGAYELIAYDQFDNILGQITIAEEDFRESTVNTAKFAQVLFGLSMDLADNIDEGNESNACRWDLMAEWGGGISGIYFENNTTGQSTNCQKSQDGYVKDKAATKISIRATNTDRPYYVDLEKPLPFANRVFLVTLNEKEIREYRCYSEFGSCSDDGFE